MTHRDTAHHLSCANPLTIYDLELSRLAEGFDPQVAWYNIQLYSLSCLHECQRLIEGRKPVLRPKQRPRTLQTQPDNPHYGVLMELQACDDVHALRAIIRRFDRIAGEQTLALSGRPFYEGKVHPDDWARRPARLQ
jgi:hypothetical protein